MGDNGGRQDATTLQGQDGRAAAVPPPGAPYGSRDFLSCGGITEAVMGKAVQKFASSVTGKCGGLTGSSEDGKTVAFDPVTIITLITTILPVITQWFQACREKRQQRQQDQTPQQQLAAAHAEPKARARNVAALQTRILQECKRGAAAERKRARQTGIPADVGRFAID